MREPQVTREPVPDAVAPPPGHPRFPLIDGARALAATTILAYHFSSSVHVDGGSWWGGLAQGLAVGVPIFFVISGFLLYRPFAAMDYLGAPAIRTMPFLWRRALRIIPLYWFALTAVFLLTAGSTDRVGGFFSDEPSWLFYAFGQVYRPGSLGGGLQQAWTLCIELTFYLFLPMYALGMSQLRRRGWGLRSELAVLGVLACASLAFQSTVVTPENSGYLARTLPSWFYLFALGMSLALLSVHGERTPGSRPLRWLSRRSGLAWGAAGVLYCLHAWVLKDIDLMAELTWAAVASLVLIPAVFDDGNRASVRRFLGNRFVGWVGLVSYGVYLLHPQVLSALDNGGITTRFSGTGNFALLAIFFACTVALASVTYCAIERPALKWKRRPPRRLLPVLDPAPDPDPDPNHCRGLTR